MTARIIQVKPDRHKILGTLENHRIVADCDANNLPNDEVVDFNDVVILPLILPGEKALCKDRDSLISELRHKEGTYEALGPAFLCAMMDEADPFPEHWKKMMNIGERKTRQTLCFDGMHLNCWKEPSIITWTWKGVPNRDYEINRIALSAQFEMNFVSVLRMVRKTRK